MAIKWPGEPGNLTTENMLQQCVECSSSTQNTHYPCGNNFLISNKTLLLHASEIGDKKLMTKITDSDGFTPQLLLQRNNIGQTALLSFACSNYPELYLGKLHIEVYTKMIKDLVSLGSELKEGNHIDLVNDISYGTL